jgi:stage II sporulation protein Q
MREEEKKRSSQDSNVKRFLKKRWAFPAIYLGSAAIILTAVLWYQNSATDSDKFGYNNEATDVTDKNFNEPAVEVSRTMENFVMPVTDPNVVEIQKQFYDNNATEEQQEAALVFYDNSYHPNTGIDIVNKDGEAFDVVAALSGKVTKVVDNDSLLGNVIEIEHDKGIVTQYQSVSDIKVKVGDEVKQGKAIATAGESLVNEEAGIHVHFEIRKDGVALNPIDYFQKPLSALKEVNVSDMENSGKDDPNAVEEEEATDDAAEKKAAEEEDADTATEEEGTDKSSDKEGTDTGKEETPATDSGKEEKETPSTEEGTDSKDNSDA